jgi:hypothetical protein
VSRTVPLAVAFRLTDNDYRPLAGESLRLFLGLGDPADPSTGTTIVTDANGAAAFTATPRVARRWRWRNIGFTGLSWPLRADHLALAAELDQVVLTDDGERHVPLLHTADIDRFEGGDCMTTGFGRIYAADAAGRFTVLANRGEALAIPGSRLLLHGPGYRMTDFMLEPGDPWRLRLAFAKAPKPVRYQETSAA